MTIAKETLKHLFGSKWKLPVIVFLSGLALVMLAHLFDVAGIRDQRDVAIAAMGESTEPPSSEQIAAVSRGRGVLTFFGVLDTFFLMGPVLVGLLLPGGVVANERQSGAIMLWAQHTMPLSRFYMHRYLGTQTANLAAQALIGIPVIIALTLPPGSVSLTNRFPEFCVQGLLGCAISFAVTSLGVRRAAFWVLAYYVASNWIHGVVLRAGLTDAPGPLAAILDAGPFFLFPVPAVRAFVSGFDPVVAWDWPAAATVLSHFALWTIIAWLGLRRLGRRPLLL